MTTEDLPLRRFVVAASGLIYWGGVWVQARRVRQKIGRSPNLRPRGLKEQALWLGWSAVVVAWIGQPFLTNTAVLAPGVGLAPGLLHPACLVLGVALVILGYACTLWCYGAMGDAWRIGIDAREKNILIQRGPYRQVRHPIYLFQIVMLTGGALLLPTLVSAFILALHCVCVLIKSADEEKYLTAVHGDAYRDYMSVTGRLFPRFLQRPPSPK